MSKCSATLASVAAPPLGVRQSGVSKAGFLRRGGDLNKSGGCARRLELLLSRQIPVKISEFI